MNDRVDVERQETKEGGTRNLTYPFNTLRQADFSGNQRCRARALGERAPAKTLTAIGHTLVARGLHTCLLDGTFVTKREVCARNA